MENPHATLGKQSTLATAVESDVPPNVGFLLEYIVEGMILQKDASTIKLEVSKPSPTNIVLSQKNSREIEAPSGKFFLTVLSWRTPRSDVVEFLKNLERQKQLPEREWYQFKVDGQGRTRGVHVN